MILQPCELPHRLTNNSKQIVILSAAIAFREANAIAESKDPYCANEL
jgi:hypothetical protein